jgi:hypothetical protein
MKATMMLEAAFDEEERVNKRIKTSKIAISENNDLFSLASEEGKN